MLALGGSVAPNARLLMLIGSGGGGGGGGVGNTESPLLLRFFLAELCSGMNVLRSSCVALNMRHLGRKPMCEKSMLCSMSLRRVVSKNVSFECWNHSDVS